MTEQRCAGTNAQGEPCGSTILVDGGPYCHAHVEGGIERLREYGRRGAEATNERFKKPDPLRDEELPELRSPRDAERLLELVARSIAAKRIGHREGDAITRAVRAWLQAHSDGTVREKLEELASTIAELKRDRLKAV